LARNGNITWLNTAINAAGLSDGRLRIRQADLSVRRIAASFQRAADIELQSNFFCLGRKETIK
jgi:hypothetical protein